jgi:drug/metabolite transporter (DMT)-like permease
MGGSYTAWAALALTFNAFAWGVSWWPFRQLHQLGVHPLWATSLIYVMPLACLLVMRPGAWRGFRHNRALWVLMVAAGLTNVGFNWAVTVGDVVRVVLLFYLMPAWVVLLAWPLLGEKPSAGSLARLGLALVGVAIVLKTPQSPWPWPESWADVLALIGGFCFALTNIMLRKLHPTPPALCMLAMFSGGALMATVAAVLGMQFNMVPALPAWSLTWLVWIIALGLMFLAGNFALQYGAARLSASATSIIMLSEVVFASGSALLLGAGDMSPRIALGGACVILAAIWSAFPFKQQPPA